MPAGRVHGAVQPHAAQGRGVPGGRGRGRGGPSTPPQGLRLGVTIDGFNFLSLLTITS